MNDITVIIVLIVLAHFAILVVANVLNRRASELPLPEEFRALYENAEYQRFQAYTRERNKLTLLAHISGVLIFLGVWAAGGFALLDTFLRSQPLPELVRGVVYVMTALLAIEILKLPLSCFSVFVVEEKHGFNRTSVGTFIADRARELAVKIVALPPFVYAILWIFEVAGESVFFWLWLFVSAVAVLQKYVLLPWVRNTFNKFAPLPAGNLRDSIMAYAAKVNYPLVDVLAADASRRTTKGGSMLIGVGKSKKAVIADTLIGKMSDAQIVALVAQQIGLDRSRRPVQDVVVSAVVHGVVFLSLALFVYYDGVFAAFGVQPSVYTGIVFFKILFPALELAIFAPVHMRARRRVFEADAYAAATLGRGDGLIEALKKVSVRSFQNLTPHPLFVTLHHDTPPVLRRIQRLRSFPATAK